MADVKINVTAEVGDAVADLKKVDASLGSMGQAGGKAGLSLTDLKSGLDLAAGALKAVQAAVQSVIDPTIDYAAQVRTLGRTIGATAEESSKLIQAADDVGISAETLQGALQAAIRKGVKPTIEGIGQLADQYNAIQDPIERTKFLMDNFGRSGAALGPLMEEGAAGIQAAGDAAEALGLVMDEEGVASARRYEIAMDDFDDAVMGVKIAIAENLLPAITDTLALASDYITFWKESASAILSGRESLVEASAAAYEVILTGKTLDEVNAELIESSHDHADALIAETGRYQGQADAIAAGKLVHEEYGNQIQSQTQWLTDLGNVYTNNTTPATYGYLAASDLLKDGLSGLTEQMIFQKAAMGLSDEAALQLGIDMGLVDSRVLELNESLPALKEKYDANHDGTIDAAESAAGYAAAVERLNAALLATPKYVESTVVTNFVTHGSPSGGGAVPAGPPGYTNDDARASGGPVSGGSAYMVGERGPEPFFPATDGYVMNNSDGRSLIGALQSIASSLAGTGTTNNYYGAHAEMEAGYARAVAGAL